MSTPYPPHPPYSAAAGTRRTEDAGRQHPRRYGNYGGPERYSSDTHPTGSTETEVINDVEDDGDVEDYDEYDYDEYRDPIDRRWIWVAGVAAAILLVAVICTVVILGGGDSGSVSKTVSPPAATTSQVPSTSAAPPPLATSQAPLPAPSGPLTPETVTTVTPEPTATAEPAPTVATADPRTITYQVTGSRPLLDLVTVIYTDAQGALQTDINVALPWSKTVVLNPGVDLTSVTATSVTGQLNCSITDAGGAAIAAQTNNSMIASCTH